MQVLHELAVPDYEFRTLEGVNRNSGLNTDTTRVILDELIELGVVRVPKTGESNMFTLASRKPGLKENYRWLRSVLGTW